jgi:16S rRNA processing protein RimM
VSGIDPDLFVSIARVTRPQGLKGAVRIRIDFDAPQLFARGQAVILSLRERRVETVFDECRAQHGRWVAKLDAIGSIDDAEKWVGAELLIPRAQLPPAGEGAFYSFELEGCRVYGHGRYVGTVTGIEASGDTDLLRVEDEGNEVLIPFVHAFLKGVDMEEKRIDMELPDGLVELNRRK